MQRVQSRVEDLDQVHDGHGMYRQKMSRALVGTDVWGAPLQGQRIKRGVATRGGKAVLTVIVLPGVIRRDKEALTAGRGSEETDIPCVPRHLPLLATSRGGKQTSQHGGKQLLVYLSVGAQGEHLVSAEHVQR